MSRNQTLTVTAIAFLCLGGPAAAQAPPPAYPPPAYPPAGPPPAPQVEPHEDFLIGVALHGGALIADCNSENPEFEDCDVEAGGLSFHVGWSLSPRLSLVLDSWVMAHTEDHVTIYQTIGTIGARLWLAPRLWVHGGLGVAHASWVYTGLGIAIGDRTESVPGGMVGVGYELWRKRNMRLDVQFRYGTARYEDITGHSSSLGAGLSWY